MGLPPWFGGWGYTGTGEGLFKFIGGGVIVLGAWDAGWSGEFTKFKDSDKFIEWYCVLPILIGGRLIVAFELVLDVFCSLFWFEFVFEFVFWLFWPKIWFTTVFVKFLTSSELYNIFNIFDKGLPFCPWMLIFGRFWFCVLLFVLLFWLLFAAFSWAALTSDSLLKTRWIIVSSLSTNLSKVWLSLNCFPLFNNLCLIGSILYISSNFFLRSIIFMS